MSNGTDIERVLEKDPSLSRIDRREMLRLLAGWAGGALVGATILGAGDARAAEPGETQAKHHYGMVVDTRRCVGCRACTIACKAENKTPPGVFYTLVLEHVIGVDTEDRPTFATKPCFHCEHPSCTVVCPVGATFKRSQDGIVVVDYDRCIGCRYCMTACPYQARYFDYGENYPAVEQQTPYATVPSPEYGQYRARKEGKSPIDNVRKCSFCLHLQDEKGEYSRAEGRWPACATTCTGHAIHFGDLADPDGDLSLLLRTRPAVRLKEEIGNDPSVYYLL
jgi:molybdopterin-containing oxidoreductase family iron-sulfur binding subunit